MEIVKSLQSQKVLKSVFVILVGTILLAVSAKIQTPLAPVPVTMQTFAVLLIGMAFGYRIGTAIVIIYLIAIMRLQIVRMDMMV